jgi:hypothetical protein
MVESVVLRDFADDAARHRREKRKRWKMFGVGLAVRLLGVALIWLGDGSNSIFRKAVVVLGLILSIGGITVTRNQCSRGQGLFDDVPSGSKKERQNCPF